MDVLNTTGGGTDDVLLAFAMAVFILAVIASIIGMKSGDTVFSIGSLFFVLVGWVLFFSALDQPVRHEVTLRPGYVIDAEKYTIVKQRGEIYVIEERKQSAAK